MIYIIYLDEYDSLLSYEVLAQIKPHGSARPITPDQPVGDLIYIRPDWPPLGDPAFADKLRAWHAEHNDHDIASTSLLSARQAQG